MAISQDLMLALLSMDSYNRGYGQGIFLTGDSLGLATIGLKSNSLVGSAEVTAGFFAQSYSWNGQTIISYRGTDTPIDYATGWSTGIGVQNLLTQAPMALAFYENTLSTTYEMGAVSNVILTGHSLGGGLA